MTKTVPPLKKPSANLQNFSAGQEKTNAIIDGLTLFATAYDKKLTPELIKVYTYALIDLTPEELQNGLRRALRETKWWPKPAELLEFCTGRISAMADKLVLDQAWKFIREYIQRFGVNGTTQWRLQEHFFNGPSIETAMAGASHTFAVSAPFYEVTRYDPPEMPDLVVETLLGMAGTVEIGLRRIEEVLQCRRLATLRSADSKEVAFLRKDFDEYCSRALAAAHANRPKTLNPAVQLPGTPGPAFPRPTETVIAYRVRRTPSGYELQRLDLEEAARLHEQGILPQHLYEESLSHYRQLSREVEVRNTPVKLVAVCTREWDCEEQPLQKLAYFAVENATGTAVIFDNIIMAVGDLDLKPGDIVQFAARPSELRSSERTCYAFDPSRVFDLSKAVAS